MGIGQPKIQSSTNPTKRKPEKTQRITTYTYMKRRRPRTKKWGPKETKKFFRLLRIFGTNFDNMVMFLKGRTRRQIKNKFMQEDKKNKSKIDNILMQKKKPLQLIGFFNNSIEQETKSTSIESHETESIFTNPDFNNGLTNLKIPGLGLIQKKLKTEN